MGRRFPTATAGRFTFALTGEVDTREYIARTLALVRLHDALGIRPDDPAWRLLSFRAVPAGDPELVGAEELSGGRVVGRAFRCVLGRGSAEQPAEDDHRDVIVTVDLELTAFAGAGTEILVREGQGAWQVREPRPTPMSSSSAGALPAVPPRPSPPSRGFAP